MTNPPKYRVTAIALLSTTFLTGCVVWKSDYDALQEQNQQLQQQLAASQQQVTRLQGAISTRLTAICCLPRAVGRCDLKGNS